MIGVGNVGRGVGRPGALTPSKGGGVPPLPEGFAFRTFDGAPLSLNGTYPIYRIA